MFSWYYPQEVTMHSYSNGASLEAKLGNWTQLKRVYIYIHVLHSTVALVFVND